MDIATYTNDPFKGEVVNQELKDLVKLLVKQHDVTETIEIKSEILKEITKDFQ